MANEKLMVGLRSAGRFEIRGLTQREGELVEGSILGGHHWIRRGSDGRLENVPSYLPLPDPVVDEEMYPFWRKLEQGEVIQPKLVSSGYLPKGYGASISIQHLCGYYYTKENYRKQAEKLTKFGFVCMRSRRGDDATFWEIWYLPGVWAAKGELEIAINDSKETDLMKKTEVAVRYLGNHVSFGTLDCSVQRLAMPVPE